ncbi:hypothetical protein [Arcanobacterium sp. S3PF19]|uniref:hypothetical protein n=1 Tax=Arcanobacterium sp. S3PF19 TaxID=1219585 RepID=UPI00050F31C7|nr:hypothetical protein [Arcanobacterium sp. S3PF19]KGF05632.1 hypothetical protein HMPREF1631_05050 [Arcanobacterium sp. S3PF19]
MDIPTLLAALFTVGAAFFAIRYIVRQRRSGAKCIGCPVEESCALRQNGTVRPGLASDCASRTSFPLMPVGGNGVRSGASSKSKAVNGEKPCRCHCN